MVTVPDTITAMALMDHRLRNFQAGTPIQTLSILHRKVCVIMFGLCPVLVALRNGEIRVYKDRFIVNTITVEVSLYP